MLVAASTNVSFTTFYKRDVNGWSKFSVGFTTISTSTKQAGCVHTIPLVQPSMAFKRPALNAEVVKPNKTVCLQQPLSSVSPNVQNSSGFSSDANYRANLAHFEKFGVDRPYSRNPTLLCDCPVKDEVI
ncbi:hypothetical protein OUZ56_031853 [Daphnia magna]|uniref:Uncharacterized protein n=1 Tax=Daphnia magna TaxID=35525 RepID=A0ABQ9ZVF0_9CRUS|nr:hypothetical protein OUZ56_031853 [Daphnia magna]